MLARYPLASRRVLTSVGLIASVSWRVAILFVRCCQKRLIACTGEALSRQTDRPTALAFVHILSAGLAPSIALARHWSPLNRRVSITKSTFVLTSALLAFKACCCAAVARQ